MLEIFVYNIFVARGRTPYKVAMARNIRVKIANCGILQVHKCTVDTALVHPGFRHIHIIFLSKGTLPTWYYEIGVLCG